MDGTRTREYVDRHARAVVRGDMEAVVADFAEELRPHVPEIAKALPTPVVAADVVGVDVGETQSVATIRYSGDGEEVTIRSRWEEQDGRVLIVHAAPAS